jgi:alkylhydroperoxidase family enzyme
MAFIQYVAAAELSLADRVPDNDNIIQVHSIHPAVMRAHWQLYRQLMHGPGPLSRRQRELIALRVSALNQCHY